MSGQTTITWTPEKSGLTVGQLRDFVAETLRADVPDSDLVQVRVGWSAQIQKIWHKPGVSG